MFRITGGEEIKERGVFLGYGREMLIADSEMAVFHFFFLVGSNYLPCGLFGSIRGKNRNIHYREKK